MDTETLKEKLLEAETRCSQWLADGNVARERGRFELAERRYAKSQYWLDRANRIGDQLHAAGFRAPSPIPRLPRS